MGQRANLIIMENGDYTLYYDHWAANSLDAYLFWGPERAISFFRDHEKFGEEYWLDTVWCEGGAIIDLDLKVLLFFGGEDILYDILLRRTYLKLLAVMWPGYSIKWAHNGVLDLANYVNYSEINQLSEPTSSLWKENWLNMFTSENEKDLVGALTLDSEGTLEIYPLYGFDAGSRILFAGERVITEARAHTGHSSFIFPDLSTESYPDFAREGIHLDEENRMLFFWLAEPLSVFEEQLQLFWPNWTIVNLWDAYEKHELLTRNRLTFLGCSEERLVERLRRIVCRSYKKGDSMIDDVTNKLTEEGKNVQVNPLIHATNLFEMPLDLQERLFDEAVLAVGK